MSMPPPKNIPPDQLWVELSKMPRPYRIVDFPRKHPETGEPMGRVAIQVLSQSDQIAASAEAERFTRNTLKGALEGNAQSGERTQSYDDIYNNASVDEVLFRAVRRADDPNALFFPTVQAIRTKLSHDEVAALFRMYMIVQTELGPLVAEMSEGEMEAWVEVLVKGGSAVPLVRLSSDGVSNLVMLMARRLHSYSMATSSSGTPPSASSSEPENESPTPQPPETSDSPSDEVTTKP